MSQLTDNRIQGSLFESLVIRQAQMNGLFVMRNYLTCHYTFKGRVQVVPGELDLRMITQDGRISFVDCKSFDGTSFPYSKLDEHQVERAVLYNDWQVPSGFIVHFRESKEIVYFTGHQIQKKGPRTRFDSSDGFRLGSWIKFDLKKIYDPKYL